jgi:hypothetical protein
MSPGAWKTVPADLLDEQARYCPELTASPTQVALVVTTEVPDFTEVVSGVIKSVSIQAFATA